MLRKIRERRKQTLQPLSYVGFWLKSGVILKLLLHCTSTVCFGVFIANHPFLQPSTTRRGIAFRCCKMRTWSRRSESCILKGTAWRREFLLSDEVVDLSLILPDAYCKVTTKLRLIPKLTLGPSEAVSEIISFHCPWHWSERVASLHKELLLWGIMSSRLEHGIMR